VALPFTIKIILRQKKNYENSNISPCKNIIFKKTFEKKPKSLKILELYDKSQVSTRAKNIIFQKSSDKNKPIRYLGAYKNPLSYYTL